MTPYGLATVESLAELLNERSKQAVALEAYFEARTKADGLALQKWRDAHQGALELPGRVDMVTWLMHQLDGTTLTLEDEDGLWDAMFGGQYRTVRYRRLEAVSPEVVRAVMAKLASGEACPEAGDVIAAMAHAEMLSQQCQRNLSALVLELQAKVRRLEMDLEACEAGLPVIVDQT
jgi:hypothetical protein